MLLSAVIEIFWKGYWKGCLALINLVNFCFALYVDYKSSWRYSVLLAPFKPLHCVHGRGASHHWETELCLLSLNNGGKVAQEKNVVFKVLQKLWLSWGSGLARDVAEREITEEVKEKGKRGRKAKGETVASINRGRDGRADSIKLLPISVLALAGLLKTGQKDMLNLLLPCASLFCSSERNQSVLLQKQLETEKTLLPCCLASGGTGSSRFPATTEAPLTKCVRHLKEHNVTMKKPEGDKTRKGEKRERGGELNGDVGASWRQEDKIKRKNMLIAAKVVIKINHHCDIWHLCTALSKNIVAIARLEETKALVMCSLAASLRYRHTYFSPPFFTNAVTKYWVTGGRQVPRQGPWGAANRTVHILTLRFRERQKELKAPWKPGGR